MCVIQKRREIRTKSVAQCGEAVELRCAAPWPCGSRARVDYFERSLVYIGHAPIDAALESAKKCV